MGKVSVETGPCFCQWVFESRPWLQQTFELPPRAISAAAVSHPLLHCSLVSSLVAFPLLGCSQSLSRCFLEGAFYSTWSGLRWYTRFPRSPGLPADVLLAHCSEQEEGVARPAGTRQSGLCLVPAVLNGRAEDHASSLNSVFLEEEEASSFKWNTAWWWTTKCGKNIPVWGNFDLSNQGYLDQMLRF